MLHFLKTVIAQLRLMSDIIGLEHLLTRMRQGPLLLKRICQEVSFYQGDLQYCVPILKLVLYTSTVQWFLWTCLQGV